MRNNRMQQEREVQKMMVIGNGTKIDKAKPPTS